MRDRCRVGFAGFSGPEREGVPPVVGEELLSPVLPLLSDVVLALVVVVCRWGGNKWRGGGGGRTPLGS